MNALTTDKIIFIGTQVHPHCYIHPTSIAYIQSLLIPFVEVIDPAPLEGVLQWIPLAFPGELAEHATSELLKARLNTIKELEKLEEDPAVQTAAKDAIIQYIVERLIELGGNKARDVNDNIIIPWDIQRGISNDMELSEMFHIPEDTKILPVTVTVGQQQFTHMLTDEFTVGLLVFSLPNVGNNNFNITLFGTPFNTDYLTHGDRRNRFTDRFADYGDDEVPTNYSVNIDGVSYFFNITDFMQGFATGALWIGVDNHKYWSNLLEYTTVLEFGERFSTPITF